MRKPLLGSWQFYTGAAIMWVLLVLAFIALVTWGH